MTKTDNKCSVSVYVTPYEDIALRGPLADRFQAIKEISYGDGRKQDVKEARRKIEKLDKAICDLSELAFSEGCSVYDLFGAGTMT